MADELRAIVSADPSAVHARGGDGQTPLHVASSVGMAQILLDHGADIDARDVDHESTPAQYLVRERPAVVRYLVERRCRTDLLMAAALGDETRVVRHLDAEPAAIRTTVSDIYFPKQDPRSGGSIYNWTLGTGKTAHVIAHESGHAGVLSKSRRGPNQGVRVRPASGAAWSCRSLRVRATRGTRQTPPPDRSPAAPCAPQTASTRSRIGLAYRPCYTPTR